MMVAYRIREKAEWQGLRKDRKQGSTKLPGSWSFQGNPFGTHLCQLFSVMPMTLTNRHILRTESLFGLAWLMPGPWRRKGRTSWFQDSLKGYLMRKAGFSSCHSRHSFWLVGRGNTHVILVMTYFDYNPWRSDITQRELRYFSWKRRNE